MQLLPVEPPRLRPLLTLVGANPKLCGLRWPVSFILLRTRHVPPEKAVKALFERRDINSGREHRFESLAQMLPQDDRCRARIRVLRGSHRLPHRDGRTTSRRDWRCACRTEAAGADPESGSRAPFRAAHQPAASPRCASGSALRTGPTSRPKPTRRSGLQDRRIGQAGTGSNCAGHGSGPIQAGEVDRHRDLLDAAEAYVQAAGPARPGGQVELRPLMR